MPKRKSIERLKGSFGKIKSEGFRFDLISNYFERRDKSGSFQVLSDKTCDDLDFDEFFMYADRTTSRVGQQYLYNKLRVIPNESRNENSERLINKILSDEDFRVAAQINLQKLGKKEAYDIPYFILEEYQKPPKWMFALRMLSFTNLMSLLLIPFAPQLFFVFIGVFIVNIVIHYWNKNYLYAYMESISQLLTLNEVANSLYKDDDWKSINPSLASSIESIRHLRTRMSFFGVESVLQSDLGMIFWMFFELFKIAFIIEPQLIFGVLRKLDSRRKDLEEIFCFVGEVDALISIASLRHSLNNYCIPKNGGTKIDIKEVYHPLITDCVRNSIRVADKSILLTGSNMSGKTSFIRSVGLNVITGLTINTCFAESAEIPHVKIYSAIRISDDLLNNKSYYFEEVLTIKEMIDNSAKGVPSLFLLDEIFKGTNTVERVAAGKAVLSELAQNNNIVFVATHDIELTDLLSSQYELYHFSEIVEGNEIGFDYKLKEGRLKNRNAIRILEINNYPKQLIDEAICISKKMDELAMVKVQ